MSAPTLPEVAAALADVVDNVTGLRALHYVPAVPQPPQAFLVLGEVRPEAMGRGIVTYPFEIVVLVSKASERVGQGTLYEYASFTGSKSLWAAFGHNTPLGSLERTTASLVSYRPLGVEEVALYQFFGGSFGVDVRAPGV